MPSRSFNVMLESVFCIYRREMNVSEIPVSYRLTRRSPNGKAIWDCVFMGVKLMLRSTWGNISDEFTPYNSIHHAH
jgi:hypothetical protein